MSLEGIKDNLTNLIYKGEDFQLVQIKYKSYSHAQIVGFICTFQKEDCLVTEAPNKVNILRNTAYRMWNGFNESGGKELPVRPPILIKCTDSNAVSTVDLAND
ncbi:hypothetical protein J3Q64DRAFT_1811668 [Phycomyces blakesleeanus]|uniref:Uncharacterized protein n=1 Tax=Phycomyces blakesleeanus TaxID=4837 RepID=A0ABR3AJ75_PHYBL